jgi:hypothetical protein
VLGVLAASVLTVDPRPAYSTADALLPVTGTEPGATNPVGAADTNMFRDDELNIWGVMRGYPEVHFFPGAPTRDDLTAWNFNFSAGPVPLGLPQGWFLQNEPVWLSNGQTDYAWPLVAMASGRVTDPLHDQAVIAGTDVFAGKVDVVLRGADGTVLKAAQLTAVPYGGQGLPPSWKIGVDVAVGDLDRLVDENGYFHDEIVVVWGPQGTDCRARMDVLDYHLNVIASGTIGGCTGRLAATIGDFNADGNLEFAAVTNDETTLRAQVCSLIVDSPGQWHPECLPEHAVANADKFPSLDVAAGNVQGVDKEEIVIATSPGAASSTTNYFNLIVLGLDDNGSLYQSFQSRSSQIGGGAAIPYVHEARVATGLFHYNPALGYDFGNRQIVTAALGISSGSQTADVWFVDFSGTAGAALVFAKAHTSTSGKHTARPSLAVGNFVGHGVNGTNTDPTMQAALTYLFTTADNINDPDITTQKSAIWKLVPPASGSTTWSTPQVWSSSFSPYFATWSYDPFIVAADYDGDSWRLGIPIHIVVDSDVSYNSLLEEPPKHVDYLPLDPDDLSKGFDMVNISGYKTFYVALKQSSTEAISTQKTDTTDWSVGGGLDLGADWQLNVGRANNPKARLDVNGELKINGSYEESTKDINSHYVSKSVTWTNSTDADDELDVSIQDMDLWRYPIIGFETGDASNPMGYYDIVVPGQTYEDQTGGKQYDWYAPLHVNNNVLSYPQTRTGQMPWKPSDVGPFEVPVLDNEGNPIVDDEGKPVMKTVTDLMADEITYNWDGNKHSLEMQFNKTDQTSHQTSFTKTFSGSLDIGAGISSRIKIPEPGVPLSFSLDIKGKLSANGKYSVGGGTVGSMQMSKSSGVTLEIPSIIGFSQEGRSYSFATAVYSSSSGGGPRVAHTIVGLVENPQDWWVKQYGRAPDPALNLPFLFRQKDPDSQHANLNWWELKTQENDPLDTRHQMRGFFMRYNDPDEDGEYELFSGNPVDGDIVRLCARVYNFSLGRATGNFDADFYYYGWNTQTGKAVDAQTGEEVYEPVWIGKASVANLDSLSTINGVTMREVCVPWDTTRLSEVAEPIIGYRFVVNLDEADVVKNEIHELKDAQGDEAPGGNNSGRWPWTGAITVSPPAPPSAAEATAESNFVLAAGDLAIKTATGFMEGDAVELTAGETYALRAHMVSETQYSGNVLVAFFDGKPSEGGKLIALELAHGVQKGDNYAWAHWTPGAVGNHELRVYAFHRVSAANRAGGTTSCVVTVVQAEMPTPTPTPTLLPTSTPGAGWREGGGCSLSSDGGGSEASGPASLVLLACICLAARVSKRRSMHQHRGQQQQ